MIHDFDPSALGARQLVERLGDPHRYFACQQQLLALGPSGRDAAIEGLSHQDATVRARCCALLDHLADAASFKPLLAVLDDPDPYVRMNALHALACDRCKDDGCRPDAADVLPRGISILQCDPSPQVRAYAVGLVGTWVHSHPDAIVALEAAARDDPSPAVRKKARMCAPGGPLFLRTRPKPARRSPRAQAVQ